MRITALALGVAAACGATGCGRSSSDGAAATSASAQEAKPAAASDRVAIDLPGDANGILWDPAASTLYVTDSANGQIEQWTDGSGFAPVASCPHDAGKVAMGGLVRDGATFVTPSFGFGSAGTVFVLDAGAARTVPNLDPVRRRIGIARAPDGTLYDTYFIGAGMGSGAAPHGGVARLDLATGETDLVTTLGKPVGVLATADTLYVSDQDQHTILAYKRDAPGDPRVVARELPGADLLAELPGGDLVTGGKRGTVSRISVATGAVATIASGFEQVRGVAYDPAKHRLFVVEHVSGTGRQHLYLVPYDANRG
jgi:DNA-binding beta-propeller fold protein YncE